MNTDNDRDFLFFAIFANELHHGNLIFNIKVAGWLVEEKRFGLLSQRPRQNDLLIFSAGKRINVAECVRFQSETGQDCLNDLVIPLRRVTFQMRQPPDQNRIEDRVFNRDVMLTDVGDALCQIALPQAADVFAFKVYCPVRWTEELDKIFSRALISLRRLCREAT